MTIRNSLVRAFVLVVLGVVLSVALGWGGASQGVAFADQPLPTQAIAGQNTGPAVDWKGQSDPADTMAGIMAGLGIVNSSAGVAVVPMISRKIIERGFVGGEINDSVWIEGQAGPIFISGTTVFYFSAHLRWDFMENQAWSLYAIGGVGGDITGAALGTHFEAFPRLALGAMYAVSPLLRVRFEVSHELIGAGIVVPF